MNATLAPPPVKSIRSNPVKSVLLGVIRWFDTSAGAPVAAGAPARREVDWIRSLPFLAMHLTPLAVIWVGWSWTAVGVAAGLYALRMFSITAFYHRYFSHRAFKTSRPMQFVFALLGNACVQRGPLWWAAHHRGHHLYSDTPEDVHSPVQYGFWWSHMGWFMSRENFATHEDRIKDLTRYPELRWLNRFDVVVPLALAAGLFGLGAWLERSAPELGTSGAQLLIWGFFISTLFLFHGAVSINSLAHVFGRQRYATGDQSRNSLLLALVTFGEGWHNNHHHYQSSVRQGFWWWEIDITWYILVAMSWTGLIWDLRPVPAHARESNLIGAREVA